jgi:hypothetical protein
MAHEILNLGDFITISIVTCKLFSDQCLILRLLTKPFKYIRDSNLATNKMIFILVFMGTTIYLKIYEIKLQRTCYRIIKKIVKSIELYKRYLRKTFRRTFEAFGTEKIWRESSSFCLRTVSVDK